MKVMTIVIGFVIIGIIMDLTPCEGLRCYQCLYYNSTRPFENYNETNTPCLNGNKLDPHSVIDCTGQKSIFQLLSLEDDANKSAKVRKHDEYLCSTVTIRATVNDDEFLGVVRGCAFESEVQQYRNNCWTQSVQSLIENTPHIAKTFLDLQKSGFNVRNSSQISVCMCSNNGCNNESSLV